MPKICYDNQAFHVFLFKTVFFQLVLNKKTGEKIRKAFSSWWWSMPTNLDIYDISDVFCSPQKTAKTTPSPSHSQNKLQICLSQVVTSPQNKQKKGKSQKPELAAAFPQNLVVYVGSTSHTPRMLPSWRRLGGLGIRSFNAEWDNPAIASWVGYGCWTKNRGNTSKMDGLFHGKPYEQMDDLGVFPLFLEIPICRSKKVT